jgi:hypothetical protein
VGRGFIADSTDPYRMIREGLRVGRGPEKKEQGGAAVGDPVYDFTPMHVGTIIGNWQSGGVKYSQKG